MSRFVPLPVGSMGLAVETIIVTTGAVMILAALHASGASILQSIAIPGVLVTAALVPACLQRREFPRIGFDLDHAWRTLRAVALAGVCVFPAVFLGLWLLATLNLPLPLRPIIPKSQSWLAWLVYQFFYVAVAEEVFFRGYVQANAAQLLDRSTQLPRAVQQSLAVVVSAGCFALAHVIVQGQIISLLTFLPGLLFAWLFLRTGTLLAPILFHGLANVSYAVLAMLLTRP